jgi:colanic acid/amylovoran biosynthesis protein
MSMDYKSRMQIILLGASLDNDNMGVNVLAASAIKCAFNCFPEAEISLLDYGKNPSTHMVKVGEHQLNIPKVNIRFSKKLYLPNNIALLLLLAMTLRCIPSASLRRLIIARNRWLQHLHEADVVLSIAGGDSFSDIYGVTRLFYVALPQVLAILMRKRLVLLPQTIGPFAHSVSKRVARFILSRANRVFTRDFHSLDEIAALLANTPNHASFCHDVGFVLDPIKPVSLDGVRWPVGPDPEMPRVGINVSGLLYRGGYTNNNMFGLCLDYRALVHEMIGLLINKKGATVLLVPHVFGAGANAESDLAACQQIWLELKDKFGDRLGVVRRPYDQSELKYIIGSCDFFVGSRMHACIAALSQAIPAVSVAYSDKFIGVMETIGVEYAVADARRLNEKDVLGVVERCFDRRDEIRSELSERIEGIKSSVLRVLDSCDPRLPESKSGEAASCLLSSSHSN